MKKIIAVTMAAGLAASVASAGVSTTFDFASAYVFRGVTYNDGAVFQPGIEADGLGLPEEYGSVVVGAWANYDIDDYGGTLNSSEFSEVDWYGSYSLPSLVDGLDLFLGYTEYTYPGALGGADKEGNIGAGYEVAGVALGATVYFNVGGGDKYYYYEFTAGYDMELTEELGASLGASAAYLDQENADSGFADGSLSAGLSYALSDVWSAGLSGAYIAQLDDKILPDGMGAYDVDFVGMLSLGASF